jgi:hypothetical protein
MEASDCAAQYVVAVYMTSALDQRATAVFKAIKDMSNASSFWEPLREMERMAAEPLPDFDVFLQQWRAVVQEACNNSKGNHPREAVQKRIEELTKHKRRNHYDHAASLAAACVAVDKSSTTSAWLAAIRNKYRRFPALQRELDRCH